MERTYTDRGELYQNKQASTVIDTRAYDDGGRMSGSTYDNGVVETRAYGTDNTLASIALGGTGTAIGNLTYGWDVNKNKTSEAIAGTMSNYGFSIPTSGYDNEDRLVSYNRTSGLSQSWGLSLVGDWNSVTTNGTSQTRTHGPTHELLTAASQSVSTDVKGNITLIPAVLRTNAQALATTWDFDNRMVTADVGNNGSIEVSQKYDALGRRVSRTDGSTTTVFALAGQQVICDYASGAAPAASTYRYLYASYIDEPVLRVTTAGSVKTYYHRNQQYSVIALTSSTGAVQERYAYTAYGEPTITNASGTVLTASAINNRYMYTGREWHNVIGQYYYRARMYDAVLGRFCSRDPLVFVDGNNVYMSYLSLEKSDPTGYGCQVCMKNPRFEGELKDDSGLTIGCVYKYESNEENITEHWQTRKGLTNCPKDCEMLEDCGQLGQMSHYKFFLEVRSEAGLPFLKSCPKVADLEQEQCKVINAYNCKNADGNLKECLENCEKVDDTRWGCSLLPQPYKRFCQEAHHQGGVACERYCRSRSLRFSEK